MNTEKLTAPQVRGAAQIANAFGSVAFPITKEDLVAQLAETTLDITGTPASLTDLVRGVPQSRFRDADHAERAVAARLAGIERWLEAVVKAERSEK